MQSSAINTVVVFAKKKNVMNETLQQHCFTNDEERNKQIHSKNI